MSSWCSQGASLHQFLAMEQEHQDVTLKDWTVSRHHIFPSRFCPYYLMPIITTHVDCLVKQTGTVRLNYIKRLDRRIR